MENIEGLDALVEQAPEFLMTYGLKALAAIVIFVIGKYFSGVAKRITTKLLTSRKVDATVVSFVANLAWMLVFVFTIVATLGQVGVQTASLVAVIGAAGLAVGLALQGSLSNFASGVLMVLFRPCRVGDFIEAAGVAGVVDEITIFSTRLRTGDNKVIIAPNSSIMNGTITNYSALEKRRIDLIIGVSYTADIAKTKKVLADILDNNPLVLKDPAYTIGLAELADSSINFVVRPWVKTSDYWPVRFELLEQIKNALDAAEIEIPFPQMDLHVKEVPAK
ncbi:mechanosensitive ion channel [Shewanella sp. SR43-4]|jgi:small conductance mechanosensitive channel|uniref:Small-conductance mechanosensitive channel n=1 Tax=Shewanella vesiculosa TaxID=518738 RepID=A0ABV0FPS1_9GAMM|nr:MULTISPECIES: mechanosensitive ion channel domain-containing protein [Shewanella]NCQ44504.1 mechanosensitive ion channel [Shewanella frigidimarina]MBB1318403.1 mechanosensitive ion channel [Shewanella sp. SR43-4]MBB1390729.1 mechanosensitive ion channel [Shewanella sp. SG44-6]MBB1474382.1 mechanosensitive ion channel [Shewanella sp. SG41-3]NCO72167.1 mechanosensitive ion channel [Shewanella vesiculosa]|tara:strand:- start:6884 stop:7717 length:834 start_codon:yes stop_codon:yes gene_type:complete